MSANEDTRIARPILVARWASTLVKVEVTPSASAIGEFAKRLLDKAIDTEGHGSMTRQHWTREQLLQTLALYCQIPFGKMHSRNPAVIGLAHKIERTPAAVALKLVNFASLDPDLRERGVGGMGNTSAADRSIWAEFFGRWDVLADSSLVVMDVPPAATDEPRKGAVPNLAPSGPTEVMRETTQRRGQSFFRAAVFAAHDGKCCITGITSEAMLRASHIVPWSHDPALRLDPRNGLCLNALHDAAFDRGLITLSDRFVLQVSKRLKAEVPGTIYKEMFERRAGTPITMPERFTPAPEMLDFHRRNVFVA
jgi:putative restriction endonuclease